MISDVQKYHGDSLSMHGIVSRNYFEKFLITVAVYDSNSDLFYGHVVGSVVKGMDYAAARDSETEGQMKLRPYRKRTGPIYEGRRYDPLHKGVTIRLGGEEREIPLLEFGWRVGLYSERESRDVATLSGLRNAETVNATHFTHMFWPTIGDGGVLVTPGSVVVPPGSVVVPPGSVVVIPTGSYSYSYW
ncbi:hypothetical protein Tco_0873938 [Tanacetum coccineum]|uniref:Peptidylprolyl isomerase n=1 Tax=Tanacetum coccineum TaxID=301880 RepID=A0ABQ5BN23_9ASTR